jgi:hypothetical protein
VGAGDTYRARYKETYQALPGAGNLPKREGGDLMNTQNLILNRLAGDLYVEPNLIMEEIMTASSLKALFRSAMESEENYPKLRDRIAELF